MVGCQTRLCMGGAITDTIGVMNEKERDLKTRTLMTLAVVGLTSTALAQEVKPDPAQIYIRDIYYSGSGCPSNSLQGMISSDGTVFTATYEQFIAKQGPNWDRLDRRKSCNLTVDLHAPQGYAFALFNLNTLGFVDLDAGTAAQQKVAMRFAGDAISKGASFTNDYYGPADEEFFTTQSVITESLVWSRCGGGIPMNITTTITATASGSAEALIGVDQQDGKLEHQFGIQWKLCDGSSGGDTGGGHGGNVGNITPNQPPVVYAGADVSGFFRNYVINWTPLADAYVNDDGLPLGNLAVEWKQTAGQCLVKFENPKLANTRFKLMKPATLRTCSGLHTITLTGNDGNASASDSKNLLIQWQ